MTAVATPVPAPSTASGTRRPTPRRAPEVAHGLDIPARYGGSLTHSADAVELVGDPSHPVIVVLGGISAGRHVFGHAAQPSPGWWNDFVGDGRAIDTRCYRILSFDYAWRADGPVDTEDQAHLLAAILDAHQISSVAAIVGSSYGGMVALAFAACFPARVEKVVVLSAAHEAHPMATAVRVVQRRIIRLAREAGRAADGVALARALGVTTYRTAEEFADRFHGDPVIDAAGVHFPVEGYLDHQGTRFASHFAEDRYLALSESLDLHRVDPARIRAPVTLVAVDRDTLVPTWQMRELFALLGGPGRFIEISSRYGHDAFLKEREAVADILVRTLGGRHVV